MRLRRFNHKGLRKFEILLESLRKGVSVETPLEFLNTHDTCESVPAANEFEVRIFDSRLELARFVNDLLTNAEIEDHDNMTDIGLWSWLGAAFLDSTCPADSHGFRKPGNDYRHIPSSNWRDFYRHLVRGPVRIFRLFQDNTDAAAIVLCQRPHSPGDFVEQLASRQERITNTAIIETANRLYYDRTTEKPRRGASSTTRRPGTLRRFVDVLDQLDLTYDLYSMSADELCELLPNEFSTYLEE